MADPAPIKRGRQPVGDDPRRCVSVSRRTGDRCKRWAIKGSTVCPFHGARNPHLQRKAAVRVLAAEARSLLERLGRPEPIADPITELVALAAEVKAWQTVLREMVDEARTLASTDQFGVERERAVVKLYGEALDRNARLLESLVRLGLSERRVKVEEQQVAILLAAVQTVLAHPDIALPLDVQSRAKELLSAELIEVQTT